MNKLSLEEIDSLIKSSRMTQEDNNIAAIAIQLAEVMRENERLREALEIYSIIEKDVNGLATKALSDKDGVTPTQNSAKPTLNKTDSIK